MRITEFDLPKLWLANVLRALVVRSKRGWGGRRARGGREKRRYLDDVLCVEEDAVESLSLFSREGRGGGGGGGGREEPMDGLKRRQQMTSLQKSGHVSGLEGTIRKREQGEGEER
jgi:hypothetical protein